jgi:hypothetical protein
MHRWVVKTCTVIYLRNAFGHGCKLYKGRKPECRGVQFRVQKVVLEPSPETSEIDIGSTLQPVHGYEQCLYDAAA